MGNSNRKYSLLCFFLIAFSNVGFSENIWIPSNESNVYGDQLQYTMDNNGNVSSAKNRIIAPGDIIILQKGTRSYLYFKNIKGNAENYITITNEAGGIVEIDYGLFNPSFKNSSLRLVECQYVKISGANSPGIKYGIKISYSFWDQPTVNNKIVTAGGTHGISLDRTNESISPNDLTSYIEIENCEITNVGAAAISAKIDGAGNGIEGPGNIFVMRDIFIHDNYLHDIGMEGIYIGQSSSNPVWHSTINVKIYDNIIARSGCEPIQIRNAWDVDVHNNVCYQASLLDGSFYGSENNGFQIERGTRGKFYNNIIMDGKNEFIHIKDINGNTADSLNNLPEGSLVSRMGEEIDFFNNYLDGGAETYTWDDPSDKDDFNSPRAAIYCSSEYDGSGNPVTNIFKNYIRNIYNGERDPGKTKAELAFFYIRDNKVRYAISDNYFSGANKISIGGSETNLTLSNNHMVSLPEIEFVNPKYGTDNFCIVPESYYYDKGTNANKPEATVFGYSKCIVPVLTLANNSIVESSANKLDFTVKIYKSSTFVTTPGKAVLMFKSCEQCSAKIVSDEIPIVFASGEISISKSSFQLPAKEWNYGAGKVFISFFNTDGTYKSNEVNLSSAFSTTENKIVSIGSSYYNKAKCNEVGSITATSVKGSIQWEVSSDGNNWSSISGATSQNYIPQSDIVQTTHYRRVVNSSSSNVYKITILSGLISYSRIHSDQAFYNIGDPEPITGNPDLIDNVAVGSNDYQWQYSMDNITFYDIPSANSQSYDPGTLTTTTYFRRNLKGCISSPYSIKVSIANKLVFEATRTDCIPDTFNVKFSVTGNFNNDNLFKIEISDASGLFTSSPSVVGKTSDKNAKTIPCKLPADLAYGNYKIRIVSTSPQMVGMETKAEDGLCRLTSISEAEVNSSKLLIYPNPFSNYLNLKFEDKESGRGTIYISDMNGTRLYESSFVSNEEVKVKSNLPPGVYSVTVELNSKKYVYKIIKL